MASEVCRPLISSTSCMTGTGLKKCIPITRSASPVAAASRVMEIEEVLVARIVRSPASAASCRKILSLSSRFSVAASIIRSLPRTAFRSVAVLIRAIAAPLASAVSFSFLTRRSRLPSTVFRPRCTAASETSVMVTSYPQSAKACAMPLPMVPAPMIPICLISISFLDPFRLRTCCV
ncbi:MAG: hypothetical protein A3H33_03075 [Betaproteobacteria bacterium RIFCSPLOWO2_02_FULL_65_20]|nr:MAG: hypothetical protein A3H33_03075 [Betaproteobacteria bacterium RIFCSPLOWO2_02_FULL_65_20]